MAQSTVDSEYRHFEASLKEARIPTPLWDGLGDVWVDSPPRAYGLIARFKDTGTTPPVRLKQVPGDWADMLGTKFAQTCRDLATQPGGSTPQVQKAAETMIASMAGQAGGAAGALGDDEKATKEARNDAFLGLPGMDQTVVARGQTRQELNNALSEAINPYTNNQR